MHEQFAIYYCNLVITFSSVKEQWAYIVTGTPYLQLK